MCLREVLRLPTKVTANTKIGYKLFRKVDNNTYKPLYSHVKEHFYEKLIWTYANKTTPLVSENGEFYMSGFHIFTQLIGARDYLNYLHSLGYNNEYYKDIVICEVEYNGTICGGLQRAHDCDVAIMMLIKEEIPCE